MGLALVAAAVAVAAATFTLTSSASTRTDPTLAQARAYVYRRCPADTRVISRSMWQPGWKFNVLYGNCRAGDGVDQHAWFFERGRFVGVDARSSSHQIIGLWRNGSTIALLYVLHRPSDPNCCATGGGAIVRYRLGHGRLDRLDRLPPPVSGKSIGR
jgi:hypothetical protein